MTSTMRAAVVHTAGSPSVFKLENRPIPVPKHGEVLIRVRAFGLNRSEMFTRQGHSPGVHFPRILGIEATGTVTAAPGSTTLREGDVVATAMGGMGRDFDGGYAEYTVVPATQVQKITTKIPWETLGAAPEMLQTAYGALFKALKLAAGESLLIRGGSTSVGLAAASIARCYGAGRIAGTTRKKDREELLRSCGFDEVVVDDGEVAEKVRKLRPQGFDKVLELVGTTSLADSLKCAAQGGLVCMAGIVGGSWTLEGGVSPMELIPSTVALTVYGGGPKEFMETPLEELLRRFEERGLKVQVGKVFKLDEIVEAHEVMEANTAGGKIVVLT